SSLAERVSVFPSDFDILALPSMPGRRLTSLSSALQCRKIGVVLTRTLLQGKRTRWQQSPFLLTANKPVQDEDKDESE
ncbi:hypothetical protein QUH41_27590, partial [Klebsiella grimontii]|nr:hypothetical protein [Klebsiella grimontii]